MVAAASSKPARGSFPTKGRGPQPTMEANIVRRQEIGRLVYSFWTDQGSDLSGVASPLLDGRSDACAFYVLGDEECDAPVAGENEIDRVHCHDLSDEDFYNNYVAKNRPVLIRGLADNWQCRRLWVKNDGPNIAYFRDTFGTDITSIHRQRKAGFDRARPCPETMSVAEYCDWWEQRSIATSSVDEDKEDENPLLYLKDYKFVAAHPNYDAYEWPSYFRDDWLNNAMGHAYKFVYLGPKGTSTPFHADVLRSYSWSTNICGQKCWYLVPPSATHLLYDCFGLRVASHIHADVEDGATSFYPGLYRARKQAFFVKQNAGETLFVPSNWYHTVENSKDTLSINHNWLNSANIRLCWRHVETQARLLTHSAFTDEVPHGTTSADNSQIDDDLVLLFHIIYEAAHSASPETGESDLHAILFVVEGLTLLLEDGCASVLLSRSDCNVEDLRLVVLNLLKNSARAHQRHVNQ